MGHHFIMVNNADIRVLPDAGQVAHAAAALFVNSAVAAIRDRGCFHACLAGGATPRETYASLTGGPERGIDWTRVQVYFGDERCVPPDHADRTTAWREIHSFAMSIWKPPTLIGFLENWARCQRPTITSKRSVHAWLLQTIGSISCSWAWALTGILPHCFLEQQPCTFAIDGVWPTRCLNRSWIG